MPIKINNKTDVNQISLGEIVIVESKGEGTEFVSIKAPSLSTSLNLILPNSNGTNGQVLSTDGSGNLSWTSGSGGDYLPLSGGTMTGSITSLGTTHDTEVSGDFFGVIRLDGLDPMLVRYIFFIFCYYIHC